MYGDSSSSELTLGKHPSVLIAPVPCCAQILNGAASCVDSCVCPLTWCGMSCPLTVTLISAAEPCPIARIGHLVFTHKSCQPWPRTSERGGRSPQLPVPWATVTDCMSSFVDLLRSLSPVLTSWSGRCPRTAALYKCFSLILGSRFWGACR